jgi:hypothetical protein
MSNASESSNVSLVQHFVTEAQEKGNFSVIDEIVHPDWVDHTAPPGVPPGKEGIHLRLRGLHSACKCTIFTL